MRSINGDFHHEDAAEDKGEEVRGGAIH